MLFKTKLEIPDKGNIILNVPSIFASIFYLDVPKKFPMIYDAQIISLIYTPCANITHKLWTRLTQKPIPISF